MNLLVLTRKYHFQKMMSTLSITRCWINNTNKTGGWLRTKGRPTVTPYVFIGQSWEIAHYDRFLLGTLSRSTQGPGVATIKDKFRCSSRDGGVGMHGFRLSLLSEYQEETKKIFYVCSSWNRLALLFLSNDYEWKFQSRRILESTEFQNKLILFGYFDGV